MIRSTRRVAKAAGLVLSAVLVAGYAAQSHATLPTSLTHFFSAESATPVPANANPYMALDGTRPISWNTCAPIAYVTNFTNAPPFAAQDLATALGQLSAASGFRFVDEGSTTAIPNTNWSSSQRLGYSGWAPVIIAFASPNQTKMFTSGDNQIGSGGAAWVVGPEGDVDVSGAITIDSSETYLPGFGSGLRLGTLFMHEMGHVLGLGEGPNPASFTYQYLGVTNQTMTPTDAAHLRVLGSGGCRTAPEPSWG
jgi:hypothetical protein